MRRNYTIKKNYILIYSAKNHKFVLDWCMKYLFRIIKILIVSTLTIFLVSVTASYLLLNIPSVQQKVTRLGEKELSKLLDTRLTIGKGHVFPFNKIQLSDVCLYDRQGDTLLYTQKLIAGSPAGIIAKTIGFHNRTTL